MFIYACYVLHAYVTSSEKRYLHFYILNYIQIDSAFPSPLISLATEHGPTSHCAWGKFDHCRTIFTVDVMLCFICHYVSIFTVLLQSSAERVKEYLFFLIQLNYFHPYFHVVCMSKMKAKRK